MPRAMRGLRTQGRLTPGLWTRSLAQSGPQRPFRSGVPGGERDYGVFLSFSVLFFHCHLSRTTSTRTHSTRPFILKMTVICIISQSDPRMVGVPRGQGILLPRGLWNHPTKSVQDKTGRSTRRLGDPSGHLQRRGHTEYRANAGQSVACQSTKCYTDPFISPQSCFQTHLTSRVT